MLGGSLGLAIKRRRLARRVVGYVRRAASVVECRKLGVVDLATRDLEEAVAGADLIVLCTPLAQMRPLIERMLGVVRRGAIVTDVGSVKGGVVRELELPVGKAGACFIGSHPMAGSERTGVAAARADLFANAVCVVTPTRKSGRAALSKVERFWRAVGARTIRMAPEAHDRLVSRSSHLPHIVAVALTNLVLGPPGREQRAALCANGFRDATRIASGSPEMWRDIALANWKNLDCAVGAFIAELEKFRRFMKRQDTKAIAAFLEQAKERRDGWCANCALTSNE